MVITGDHRTYFVVFTTKNIVDEYIHWIRQRLLEKNATKFNSIFQDICTTYLLGITQIFICPVCDDPCLKSNEFDSEEENSIQCDTCNIWVHWRCNGVTKETGCFKELCLSFMQVLELKICSNLYIYIYFWPYINCFF